MAHTFSTWGTCQSGPLEGLMCFCTRPLGHPLHISKPTSSQLNTHLHLMITLLLCPFPVFGAVGLAYKCSVILYSPEQWFTSPLSPLIVNYLFIMAITWCGYIRMLLMCIPQLARVENVFMYLLAIYVFSLEKCLFISFVRVFSWLILFWIASFPHT